MDKFKWAIIVLGAIFLIILADKWVFLGIVIGISYYIAYEAYAEMKRWKRWDGK